jgi:hypothetical protein
MRRGVVTFDDWRREVVAFDDGRRRVVAIDDWRRRVVAFDEPVNMHSNMFLSIEPIFLE